MPSHFYHPQTGELIDGNLRDARKINALPSPTTVLSILGSPGLKWYFRRQMFEAAATTPRPSGQSDDDYFDACCLAADEHSKAARDKGGDFHTLVQRFHERMSNEPLRRDLLPSHIAAAAAAIGMEPQFNDYTEWFYKNVRRSLMVEKTVIGQGYAGRVDHVAEMMDGRIACLDCKTQDTTKKKGKFTFYDSWPVQLGAYAGAIRPQPDCLISVAISSNLPAVVEAKVWEKPVEYYHGLFLGLLAFWNHSNNYHPM